MSTNTKATINSGYSDIQEALFVAQPTCRRLFDGARLRKWGYLLAVALMSVVFEHSAYSQTCWIWENDQTGSPTGDLTTVATAMLSYCPQASSNFEAPVLTIGGPLYPTGYGSFRPEPIARLHVPLRGLPKGIVRMAHR